MNDNMDIIKFWNQTLMRAADVDEPEFERLYVRKGPVYLPVPPVGKLIKVEPLLQIANLTAKKPRTGAFTRLLYKIGYSIDAHVFVENVLDEGFAGALDRMGFVRVNVNQDGNPPCFLSLRGEY
jgi:hypothetical protein